MASLPSILIKNAFVVNEGQVQAQDILVRQGRIERVAPTIDKTADIELNAEGKYLFPGVIDDQVHFREPGLTHKADIFSEARAAVAGGTTSFMEMPNTKPTTTTQIALEAKYERARAVSLANYSFYMGASNDNLEEVLRTNPKNVCGVKVFMGSSTGNMLVDDPKTLENIFSNVPMLIATHCEDEETIRRNEFLFKQQYGDNIPVHFHPAIRSADGCYRSSRFAVELAQRHQTRLHILHISTRDEIALFDNQTPLAQKRITAEVCVHHLWFNESDYAALGTQIKCNPAIKSADHQTALFEALLDDHFDVIATDHAPHTWAEKQQPYFQAPSGLPLVQHALNVMLDFHAQGRITLPRIAEKMAHAPAVCFGIAERGFIREGYWADLVLVDLRSPWTVRPENTYAKCGWSPFQGHTFGSQIISTVVSGHLAYHEGVFNPTVQGQRLLFDRL